MTFAPLLSFAAVAGGALAGAASQSIGDLSSAFADLLKSEPAKESDEPQLNCAETLPSSLASMEASAREALARFRELLAPKLAQLGIDMSRPITLSVNGLGNVRETSGHPQAQQIEHLLETNDEAANCFRQAAAQFAAARAGREHEQFSQLYANNPELAVEQYAHLFDERREAPKFSLRLSGDLVEPVFE